ncbi:hypothetical protein ACFY1U_14350 [Streptomyces sp. NPDC001351]
MSHLQEWIRRQERDVPGEFLQGAAYKLGSGAVTLRAGAVAAADGR